MTAHITGPADLNAGLYWACKRNILLLEAVAAFDRLLLCQPCKVRRGMQSTLQVWMSGGASGAASARRLHHSTEDGMYSKRCNSAVDALTCRLAASASAAAAAACCRFSYAAKSAADSMTRRKVNGPVSSGGACCWLKGPPPPPGLRIADCTSAARPRRPLPPPWRPCSSKRHQHWTVNPHGLSKTAQGNDCCYELSFYSVPGHF